MMTSFLYQAIVLVGFLVWLPGLIYQRVRHGKYRESFWQRLGWQDVGKLGDGPVLWVHAVSVGEAKAVAPLVKRFVERVPGLQVIVSSVTETGHGEAKRAIPMACAHIYLPFDFRFVIGPLVRKIRPDLVILSEGDMWFNFLQAAKDVGAVNIVVNGKVSEKSARRLGWIAGFTRKLLSLIDCFCVQSSVFKERFMKLGVPEEKIRITGNLKFDIRLPSMDENEKTEWRKKLGIEGDGPVVVLGSTHDPEEQELLGALEPLWEKFADLKVIVVPRHPERFDHVAKLIEQAGRPWSRLSDPKPNPSIILVDAMGVLLKCYEIADVAVVAGSFSSCVGGHNILEPLEYGVPALYGPHMHAQPSLTELGLGKQVESQDLASAVAELIDGQEAKAAYNLDSLRGGTEKTLEIVKGCWKSQESVML